MLQLTSGVRLDGDLETVYRSVDDEQAAGDGLYLADLVESTGLSAEQVRTAVAALVDLEVLQPSVTDPELGPRYVRGRAT